MNPESHVQSESAVLPPLETEWSGQLRHSPASKYSFAEHVILLASHVSLCPGFPVNPESHVQSESTVLPSADEESAGQLSHAPPSRYVFAEHTHEITPVLPSPDSVFSGQLRHCP